MRRPERASKMGFPMPAPKKLRVDEDSCGPAPSAIEQYERHIEQLKKLYHGGKWSTSVLCSLLQETAELRRKWIKEE